METAREVTVVVCDGPNCKQGPNEQRREEVLVNAGLWYKLEQQSTAGSIAAIDKLDFCSEDCVHAFMDAEILVSMRRDNGHEGVASFLIGSRR